MAIYAIPIIISGLGTEKFGTLTLVWVIVGYFSLFDFGIARALTKETALLLGRQNYERIPPIIWTSLTIMTVIGLLSCGTLVLLAPVLVSKLLHTPLELQEEMQKVVVLIAISIPIVMNSSAIRGVVEAHQRFVFISVMKLLMGGFVFLSPIIVLKYTDSLYTIVLLLITGRLVIFLLYCIYSAKIVCGLFKKYSFCIEGAKYLLSFGGWIMVSSVVGPILLYLDRFMIAAVVSTTAVAYYVTPYEVVSKTLILPVALITVLFPVFSQPFNLNKKNIKWAYYSGATFLFVIIVPIALVFCLYARELLELWLTSGLGLDAADFAEKTYRIAQFLMVGVLVNSFGHLSQALIQGYGRPDLTAKLHLVELLLFVVHLWILVNEYGAIGAAIAWLVRVSISTVVLSVLASLCLSQKLKSRYA